LQKLLKQKIVLPSGGYLILEHTEALTVIDVNTGKFTGGRNLEDTLVRTNIEAAAEIARQVRLRDIGGIIVVDFIDMAHERSPRQQPALSLHHPVATQRVDRYHEQVEKLIRSLGTEVELFVDPHRHRQLITLESARRKPKPLVLGRELEVDLLPLRLPDPASG